MPALHCRPVVTVLRWLGLGWSTHFHVHLPELKLLYHETSKSSHCENWLVSVQILHLVRFLAFSDGGIVW